MDVGCKLTAAELAAPFQDPAWGNRFPPVLTCDQAAELLQIPKQTIYDWHSRGLLAGCCRKIGKHLRFFRPHLLTLVFNKGLNENGR
jgi:excisionase family DNA binding protein